METLVLSTTALSSFGALLLQTRARAFFVLFLHVLLSLTVGSLTFRALSGGGTLLLPFVDGWHRSPFMQLTHIRAYIMLAISLITTITIFSVKARVIWALPQTAPASADQSFAESPYCCLMMVWIHVGAIVSLLLL